MRDRLVATFVGLTLLVLALFAVPAAYVVAHVVQDQEQQRADRVAEVVAAAVDARLTAGTTVDEAFLASLLQPDERVDYRDADGSTVVAGDVDDAGPRSTRPVVEGGSVTLTRSQQSVADQVADDVLPLSVLALVLAAAAGAVGVVVARRVARPFGDLSEVAADIGAGRFDTPVPRFGVHEADQLGRTLRDTARRLEILLGRERAFAVNASHELRTPLTALRLSLEDVTLWDQVPPAVVAELTRAIAEVDRLGAAVTRLLEERRDEALDEEVDVDLAALTSAVVDRWREPLAAQDRGLVLKASTPVPATIAPRPVEQVVDALLARATGTGSGTVTVDVSTLRTVLRVRVSDQGDRGLPSGVLHGDDPATEAAGLADAATAAEAAGGYLTVQDARQSRLLLILPHRRRP